MEYVQFVLQSNLLASGNPLSNMETIASKKKRCAKRYTENIEEITKTHIPKEVYGIEFNHFR